MISAGLYRNPKVDRRMQIFNVSPLEILPITEEEGQCIKSET